MQEQRALGAPLAVDQLELVEGVVVGENSPAVPGERRGDHEPQLVDQPRAEQDAGEPDAAVDPDVAAGLLLQVGDVVATGAATSALFAQSSRGSVEVTTCLGAVDEVANGSTSDVGQYPTQ